jgi:putative ABC transport system permease protein
MLKNYIKMALKVLVRRKFFTAISLFGVGFTLMVLLVASAMLDHMLAPVAPEVNMDRTLMVSQMKMLGGTEERQSMWSGDPGYKFLDRYCRDIPGVEKFSISSANQDVASFLDGEKVVSKLRQADGTYWEILDFSFIEGGAFTQQDEEQANMVAVINEATRHRFFGDEQALGRFIEADGQRYRVVGVVENVSITRVTAYADIWAPHSTARSQSFRDELMGGHLGLLLAGSRADFPAIKAEFHARLPHVEFTEPWHTMEGHAMTMIETAAVQMSNATDDKKPPVYRVILLIIGLVAAFLFLPTVNLVSINLSRIIERSSEIGVRKAFGASSGHLVIQFIVENLVLCLVGGLLALAGAATVLELAEASSLIPHAEFHLNFRIYFYALGLALFFGLISGAYPAWRTSRLHPVEALRGGAR